ncbi:MAG: heme ABC exporter ATP-binding protein CcmA [Candidatus Hydrothermarchaeaceae archaeon]
MGCLSIVEVKDLSKKFGRYVALDGVSLSVSAGESFAILGPNGAGKTTLVRILSTLLKPSSGTVTISGYNAVEEPEEIKMQIGVVSHNPFLYDDLTAFENLSFYADLYDVDRENIDALIKKVGLYERRDSLVEEFSRGMKQRLSIARALLHEPQILILDEATAGLDIQSKHTFYDTVKGLNKKGTTVLLTTHYLDEVEELCQKAVVLDQGTVKASGKLKEIKGGAESLEAAYIKLTGGAR